MKVLLMLQIFVIYLEDVFKYQKLATAETHFTSIVISEVNSERVKTEKAENKPIVANLSLAFVWWQWHRHAEW